MLNLLEDLNFLNNGKPYPKLLFAQVYNGLQKDARGGKCPPPPPLNQGNRIKGNPETLFNCKQTSNSPMNTLDCQALLIFS